MKYETSVQIITAGSQYDLGVVIKYRITSWGSPELGRFGPPENYDPGSPPEFDVESVNVNDGKASYEAPQWLADIITDDECVTGEMIDLAFEERQAAREDAAEARREALRDER